MAAPFAFESVDLARALDPAPVPLADWLVVAPVLVPLLAGALLLTLWGRKGLAPRLLVPALVLTVAANLLLLARVLSEGPMTMVMGRWLPPFGIAFTADILGSAFSFAGSLAALAVGVFQRGDAAGIMPRYHPAPFILIFLAGASGAFLTGDMFNLYVWFEVLLIASFGLFALGPERAQIDGTLKYGFLNLVGTTLFLVAVGLIYGVTGTLNMADLAQRLPETDGAPLVTLTALFFFAFSMKAAAFPVQFWLPAAYHTPRASSAALFAALPTKVGVYAMLRVGMLLPAPVETLSLLIALVAAGTMIFGALGVLQERDLRRLPGYVLISGIGTMLAGLALGSPGGVAGTIFYGLQSTVLMAALYLALFEAARLSGANDLMAGGGLYDRHPYFSGLVLALFLAAAGLPPFSGFWPKALIVKAAIDIGAWWLAGAVLVSGFLLTLGLARAFLLGFWRPAETAAGAGPARAGLSFSATLPLACLGFMLLALGIAPEGLLALSSRAAAGLADPSAYVQSVFPGGTP